MSGGSYDCRSRNNRSGGCECRFGTRPATGFSPSRWSNIETYCAAEVGRSRLVKLRIAVFTALSLFVLSSPAQAGFLGRWFGSPNQLVEINNKLKGRVLDYTFNHGKDNRMYSPALDEKRDMYIYLPPGYDP